MATDAVITYLTAGIITEAKNILGTLKAIAAEKSPKIKSLFSFVDILRDRSKLAHWLQTTFDIPSFPDIGGKLKTNLKALFCKLGFGCFVAGTPVMAAAGNIPIEQLKIGDKVWANTFVNNGYAATKDDTKETTYHINADGMRTMTSSDNEKCDATAGNFNEWFAVSLNIHNFDGNSTKVQLLRPQWWLDANRIKKANDVVFLSLPEMGLEGYATLTDLAHYRKSKNLDGETDSDIWALGTVIGIFEHTVDASHKLILSNGDTLGVTAPHPFYSLDRQCFVAAAELRVQEKILAQSGFVFVISNTIVEKPQQVYNLEVRQWHNFLVGKSGVVVHNSYENVKKAVHGLSTKYSELLENVDDKIFEFTGRYGDPKVRGHHPLCKAAFLGGNKVNKYNKDDAFCISEEGLKAFCPNYKPATTIHAAITGRQSSRYSAWQKNNPQKIISLEEMIDVEIGAMTDVGIPDDVAKTWMAKALKQMNEDFDIREITQTPWGFKPD